MDRLYRDSLSLLTDLYQLTMAYGYFANDIHEHEAVFHLYFRKHPFQGGYTVACGLEYAIDYLKNFKFDESDIDYLKTLEGTDGERLFPDAFLDYLAQMEFECDIDAVEEGTIVFPNEPILRIKGPIAQCQLLETPLLNILNFQSLVATKAARVCYAAAGDSVLEFGLRRAQGVDGGVAASRAAYVGGCTGTSNVLAGKLFGIPVKGTHAHSWVMTFDTEMESFRAYAKAMPNNAVFLVDTYDTLEGVKHAITVGEELRAKGHEMIGIRLDSGDLAYLSIEARKLLDAAGFESAAIVASNNLDEYVIDSLKQQGATIAVWGVGTKLATAYDQPALGGVYKLAAIREQDGEWEHRLKLSEQVMKTSTPGILATLRFYDDGEYIGDLIYDELSGVDKPYVIVDPADITRRKKLPETAQVTPLLAPVFRNGVCVYESPSLHAMRERTMDELEAFHSGIKRLMNPHEYPVGFDLRLHKLKTELVLKARGFSD